MAECFFNNGSVISDYGRPYIVAEVNSSHRGSVDTAKKMIDVACEIGCDCVKFQSWSAESLYSKSYYKDNPISRRIVSKMSLSSVQLKELADYCKQKRIAFSSTPYSEEEVDFLIDECEVPFIKIASMEINNIRFLNYIGRKKVPVVLSTGMSDISEVDKAVEVLRNSGVEQLVLLHCVSVYPTELSTVNLNNIIGLRERYENYPIGFSDHTEGDAASVAAVALGAGLIEKHLTLDRSMIGMDNGMAIEPDEFKLMVSKCRNIHTALGHKERTVSTEELKQRLQMRRSITASVNIIKGQVLTESDLYAKRPGTGLSPDRIDDIVGKIALHDIEADTIIYEDDIADC